jgi:hypothetical protein
MGELRKYLAIAKIVDPTSVDTQAATMGLSAHDGAIFVNIPELGLEGDNLVYCRYGLSLPYLRVKVDDKLWVEPTVGETGRWIFTSFADCAGRVEPSSEGLVIKDDEYEIIIDKVAKTLTVEMTGDDGIINLVVGSSGEIRLTSDSASEKYVLGDIAKVELEKDLDAMTELQTAINGWIPVAQDGGAALKTALAGFLAKTMADYSNILSEQIKGA